MSRQFVCSLARASASQPPASLYGTHVILGKSYAYRCVYIYTQAAAKALVHTFRIVWISHVARDALRIFREPSPFSASYLTWFPRMRLAAVYAYLYLHLYVYRLQCTHTYIYICTREQEREGERKLRSDGSDAPETGLYPTGSRPVIPVRFSGKCNAIAVAPAHALLYICKRVTSTCVCIEKPSAICEKHTQAHTGRHGNTIVYVWMDLCACVCVCEAGVYRYARGSMASSAQFTSRALLHCRVGMLERARERERERERERGRERERKREREREPLQLESFCPLEHN